MEVAFKDFLNKLVYEKNYKPIYDALEEAARAGLGEAYFYDGDCEYAIKVATKEGLLCSEQPIEDALTSLGEPTLCDYVRVWGWVNDA